MKFQALFSLKNDIYFKVPSSVVVISTLWANFALIPITRNIIDNILVTEICHCYLGLKHALL